MDNICLLLLSFISIKLFTYVIAPITTGDPELQEELRRIITAWDPSSPQCQLQHYLYNLVHPDEVHLYQRPPNHNETLWKQAQQDNPDPSW
jgi:hypothetical protein